MCIDGYCLKFLMLALSTGSKRTGNIATDIEVRAVNEVHRSVALIAFRH